MKIRVRGVTYDSVKEAAAELGVTIDGVYGALNRGGLETLGLGKTQPKTFTVGGITFRSMTQASLSLGFNRSYLRWALNSGGTKAKDRVAFAILRYKARKEMEDAVAASAKGAPP